MNETTKRLYLYVVMAITLLPAFFVVPLPAQSTVAAWSLWGSAIAGYVGIVFMLWMYAIGTRATSALFFIDQAKLINAHKWLGKYGTLLIFLHPVLITISLGQGWLYSFIPSLASSYEKHVTYGRIALYALLIVWITSALMRSNLSYRAWKYLHFLSYAAVPFALLHIPDIGVSYAAEFAARAYFFMIILGFLLFSLLRARDLLMFNKYHYRLVRKLEPSPNVFFYELEPIGDALVSNPGQYIYVKQALLGEEHPFSVTQYDQETNHITVTFKVFGRFTRLLADAAEGDELMLMGPFGEFTKEIDEEPKRPTVYVAGGIGITPFVDRIMTESRSREQWLFYAAKSPEQATYAKQLSSALRGNMISIYSESMNEHEPNVERGVVSASTFSKYLHNVTNYHYFICGPAAMMDAVKLELASLGVRQDQIHTEDFSF